ncbi:MAG: hypothetical protein ACHQQQ_08690 [Bacteroidota bacterium]
MKSEKIENLLTKASEKYAKKTGLRIVVGLIPRIGGSLNILLTSRAQRLTQERFGSLLLKLASQLEAIDEDKIYKQFLDSEEWFDLIFRAFEKAIRTRSAEKIQLYSKILIGALINPDNREHSESFLDVLAELSEIEVRFARLVYEFKDVNIKSKDDHGQPRPNKFLEQCTFIDRNDLQFYMKRLERVGLVNEQIGMILGYDGGLYHVTPTFDKLMKAIS